MKPISGITISFTKDEIEWLSWVLSEILAKAPQVSVHDDVAMKVDQAMQLVKEFQEFGDDWQQHQDQRGQQSDTAG